MNKYSNNEIPQKPKKKRKGFALFIFLVIIAIAAGLVIHNISMDKWVEEQYSALGIEEGQASDLMQKTLKDFYKKYKNLNPANTAQMEKYLDEIDKNVTKTVVNKGVVMHPEHGIYGVVLAGDKLEIRMDGNGALLHSNLTYSLTAQQVQDIENLKQNMPEMVPAYIYSVVNDKNIQPQSVQNFQYGQDRFVGEFATIGYFMHQRGIEVKSKYFYIKSVDLTNNKLTIGYNDGIINSWFTIDTSNIQGISYDPNTGGVSLRNFIHQSDDFFEDIAEQFATNANISINLTQYFNASGYNANTNGQ